MDKYIEAKYYIIDNYSVKEDYICLDSLKQELKENFNVNHKEFEEIILKQLLKENLVKIKENKLKFIPM